MPPGMEDPRARQVAPPAMAQIPPAYDPAPYGQERPAYPTDDLYLESSGAQAYAPAQAAATPATDIEDSGTEAPIPRISIHLFAETSSTLKVGEQVRKDRRLSRAQMRLVQGGIATALETYVHETTPALIIIECMSAPQDLLTQLDQLAEVCDAGTKVIVLGALNDIRLYRELMRRGVSEYLAHPIAPLPVIRAISTLYSDPDAPFVGRAIAFIGARGGVGASSLAHNVAWNLSETLHAQTVLTDLDMAFGTVGLDFNQDPVQGMADALGAPERLDTTLIERMMAPASERLNLFTAPASLDHDLSYEADAYEEVLQKLRSTAPFVLLDVPHLWSSWIKRALLAADDVVIVATPDLASLRNTKNLVDLLRPARPNDAPARLILNQVGLPGRPEIPVKEFAEAVSLTPEAIIPFDAKSFGLAANKGQMLAQAAPQSKAHEALMGFAQALTGRAPPPAAKASWLASLFKKK